MLLKCFADHFSIGNASKKPESYVHITQTFNDVLSVLLYGETVGRKVESRLLLKMKWFATDHDANCINTAAFPLLPLYGPAYMTMDRCLGKELNSWHEH